MFQSIAVFVMDNVHSENKETIVSKVEKIEFEKSHNYIRIIQFNFISSVYKFNC